MVLDDPYLLTSGPTGGSAIAMTRSAVAGNLFSTSQSNF